MTYNYIGSLSLNLPSRLSLGRKGWRGEFTASLALDVVQHKCAFRQSPGEVHCLKLQTIARLEMEVLHAACTDNLAESF